MQDRPRILIVDDVPENIEVLGEILADNYDIQCAFSGPEALELAVDRPDLILLDVLMPGMDGLEVCACLKANAATAEIPVIFITAKNNPEAEIAAFAAGAVDFITKPVNPVTARARIQTHLTLKQQKDLLRAQAMVDGLTGIANRRFFDERLLAEWRHLQRHQRPLALLMIDIDHFKAYNDHYGHQAGDNCLRRVATTLGASMQRAHDLAARYGGEEFVCMLPECDLEGAATKAEAVRLAVATLAIPHAASPSGDQVTLSIGVAAAIPSLQTHPDTLVSAADAQLYQAKVEGRDRVRAAP
ncbi:MAG: diguanylate cyclase [Gammaproteobacteria bacterium]|jgi:diguanylate cyclase (GGDEF)-like protein|nr:diguanylate cyclase [Gammaproteobacteria bacterium]